jgi:hypothetical protein
MHPDKANSSMPELLTTYFELTAAVPGASPENSKWKDSGANPVRADGRQVGSNRRDRVSWNHFRMARDPVGIVSSLEDSSVNAERLLGTNRWRRDTSACLLSITSCGSAFPCSFPSRWWREPMAVERLVGDCGEAAGTLDCSCCSRILGSSVYDSLARQL